MKTHVCTLALLALGTALPAAESVSEAVTSLGMLPNQRTGLHINATERNPFAVKPKEVAKNVVAEDTETQESKIRSIFRQIRVAGVRRDRNGRFLALAGDLILRQGEEVKPVLEDQTEVLIVSKIEPRQIELTFVEDKDSTQPRIIIMSVKNQVQVAQKLFGQPKGKAGLYIARGRNTPDDVEEAAAAIAAAPPTAPASASPAAVAAGGPVATTPPAPRDSRREAAALAGLSEPALAELIGGGQSTDAAITPSATPSAAAPPAPSPAPPASNPAAAPAPPPSADMVSPPTQLRRRTSPPVTGESPPPTGNGVVE